jgi:hypothetical protein
VSANHLARLHRFGHLGVHLGVAQKDAGEVHHLAQADDARPLHRLGHFGRDRWTAPGVSRPGALGTQLGICT